MDPLRLVLRDFAVRFGFKSQLDYGIHLPKPQFPSL